MLATAVDKSPTAVDFTDITELADEGEEGEGEREGGEAAKDLAVPEEDGMKETLFQKGVAFAQAGMYIQCTCRSACGTGCVVPAATGSQLSGGGQAVVSMETDDYDMDSEEVPTTSIQLLPSNSNEEGQSLSQRADSGYGSGPSSLPLSQERASSLGSQDTPSFQSLPPPSTSLPAPCQESAAVMETGSYMSCTRTCRTKFSLVFFL